MAKNRSLSGRLSSLLATVVRRQLCLNNIPSLLFFNSGGYNVREREEHEGAMNQFQGSRSSDKGAIMNEQWLVKGCNLLM